MRIIGGHDYFDSALAYGRDETLVLTRTRYEDKPLLPHLQAKLSALEVENISLAASNAEARNNAISSREGAYHFSPRVVWFAGKRYGGIRVEQITRSYLRSYLPRYSSRTEEWFWSADKFLEFLDIIGASLKRPERRGQSKTINAANIRDHFEDEGKPSEVDWLIENGVSIAVWHDDGYRPGDYAWDSKVGWKINVDGLGNMGFAKRLDPFAAFQELSMWVGGVLPRSPNPTVEITNEKVILKKHGMDEWSFKTPPSRKM